MEKEQIRPFLYRVATDPAYRSQLEADPASTLDALGCTIDPDDVPDGGIQLPSNEDILAKLDDLTDQFEGYGCACWDLPFLWKGQ